MSALATCNACEAAPMAPGQESPQEPGYCRGCLAETIRDPGALARALGGNVCAVYRDPCYKRGRWTWTTYTPQGGSGSGANRSSRGAAMVAASQMASPVVILEAVEQGRDPFGYPAAPDRYQVAAERREGRPA